MKKEDENVFVKRVFSRRFFLKILFRFFFVDVEVYVLFKGIYILMGDLKVCYIVVIYLG